MNNISLKLVSMPIKMNAVRIDDLFQSNESYPKINETVIKDYMYYPKKRIIA